MTAMLLAGGAATSRSLTSEVKVENPIGPLRWVRVRRRASVTKTCWRLKLLRVCMQVHFSVTSHRVTTLFD